MKMVAPASNVQATSQTSNGIKEMSTSITGVDQANAAFWDELCGSSLARSLGVSDRTAASLARFDGGYLDLYPYLLNGVPVHALRGRDVLEVGLGYGTLGQKLIEAGAKYTGLDIARGPVDMMNHRQQMMGMEPSSVRGSMLECPFPDEAFDAVVSIGCFHHTGDVARCVREMLRVLRSGGRAFIIVYNRYSYQNWMRWPIRTYSSLRSPSPSAVPVQQRAAFDPSPSGNAAPETAFLSVDELRNLFQGYSSFSARKRNWGGIIRLIVPQPLRMLLLSAIGRLCGLDIYVSAVK